MAEGARHRLRVDVVVAVTGIAGPGGAVPGKPVGLVHFAACSRTRRIVHQERQFGDIGRTQVREASVAIALDMLRELAETE
jgi:nicotinamide-nucleotide amidase